MALRPSGLLAILAATAFAGCSGGTDGGADGYPQAYMLGTYGVPDGFELMDEDSEYWGLAEDEYGMESNPGYADPEALEETSEDDEDGTEEDIPAPEKLYVAVYVRESDDSEEEGGFGFPEMIISMAAKMNSESDIDAAFSGEDNDICEDAESGEDVGFFVLRDGLYIAVVISLAEDVEAEIDASGDEMQAATGAESFCDA